MLTRVGRPTGILAFAIGVLVAGSCKSSKLSEVRPSDPTDAATERVRVRVLDGSDDAVDGMMVDAAAEAPPEIVGPCTALPLGAPAPGGACPDTGPASCGFDGTCDGAGGCHRYPAGTECAAPTCLDSATVRPASVCDGEGTCTPSPAESCSPYTCVDGACDADDCKFIPSDCVGPRNLDASPG